MLLIRLIDRVRISDISTVSDSNSPNFIVETNAAMYKQFPFDKTYAYDGRTIHQSPPACEMTQTSSGSFQVDGSIDAKYAAVWQALSKSFGQLQAAN